MHTMTEAAEQLKHDRDRFVAFAFASADILLELDDTGTIIFADGATKGLLGRSADEIKGNDFWGLIHQEDKNETEKLFSDLSHKHRMENIRVRLNSRHNESMPFAISGFKLSDMSNHTYLSLSILKGDVPTEELFRRDFETGLLKKKSFVDTANAIIHSAKDSGASVNVTLIDLPELKSMLDQLPADAAERLMMEITGYMRSKSINGDTAGMIEGNAYSIVSAAPIDAKQMASDIITITKSADPEGKGVKAVVQSIDAQAGKLTTQDTANALLYTITQFAQRKGETFDIHSLSEGYESMLDETLAKIAHFKETVDADKFQIAFQPIVDIKTGIIHHFEALVRFEQSDVFSNPFQFITFGEQAGIINEFDLAMCEKTLDILNQAAGKGQRPLVSVNLSGKSLSSRMFLDAIHKMLVRNDNVRKQVIFEVTESAKITDMKLANDFLQELRAKGNLCCLDDFGTGESSFDYLRNLQVDFIKIDGSYVKESANTQRGKHMLKALAGLCRDLDVVTIGEMVEDEKVAALLWEAGVKFGQGYLFGKPTVDVETLINCSRPTPFYGGIMRAKRIRSGKRSWWAREE